MEAVRREQYRRIDSGSGRNTACDCGSDRKTEGQDGVGGGADGAGGLCGIGSVGKIRKQSGD